MSVDSLVARAALPSLIRALDRWHEGRLTLELPDGDVRRFGRGASPPARVRVKSPALLRRLLLQADVGFGESYMEGEWEADDLPSFLLLLARNEDALGVGGALARVFSLGNDLLHRLRRNTRAGSRKNIAFHYDLSNDFFRLFLDPETLTYSSALFAHAGQTLGEAQRNKYRVIADKARLAPGDHVLEIGCGWGGFALYAAGERGCRVTAITISERQHALARERVAEAGLSHRVDLRRQDYRDLDGRFDAVVSIEMFEALGREHWPIYFRTIEEVLAPRGLAVIQTISVPDHRFEAYERRCDWIQKHIFPGGVLASVHHLTGAMIRDTRLNVHHLEDIGPHYALTLARWREAFLARRGEVLSLGFDERFVRTWDFYLASCQAYFEARRIGNLQIVLARPGNESLGVIPAARRDAPTGAARAVAVAGREVAA